MLDQPLYKGFHHPHLSEAKLSKSFATFYKSLNQYHFIEILGLCSTGEKNLELLEFFIPLYNFLLTFFYYLKERKTNAPSFFNLCILENVYSLKLPVILGTLCRNSVG